MTEALTTKPEEVNQENDSGTDSDGEDSIPELEVLQRIYCLSNTLSPSPVSLKYNLIVYW